MQQASSSFEIIRQINCQKHTSQPQDQIDLTGSSQNGRICKLCIQENKIPFEQYLSMAELFTSKENKIFHSYPPFKNQKILQQIQKYCNENVSKSNIDSFFHKLRGEIEIAIQEAENRAKQVLIKNEYSQQILLKQLNNIAETDKLKELLVTDSEDLNNFLSEKWQNAELNEQTIQKCINLNKESTSIINFESKQKEANYLIQSLSQLRLFDEIENNNNCIRNTYQNKIIHKVNFIKSTYGNSSAKLIVNKTASNALEAIAQGGDGQAYFNFILNSNKRYTIRLNYQTKSSYYLLFGIVPDEQKDANWSLKSNMCYHKSGSFGINKYIKGLKINEGIKFKTEFEVRIFLDEKILKTATLPDYETIIELDDPNKILPQTQYRFFIHISDIGDKVEITDIIESDSFENNSF